MTIPLIVAALSTLAFVALILRRGRATASLVMGILTVASWLLVGVLWLTEQWTARITIRLPDLRYILVALSLTLGALLAARLLSRKAMKTVAAVVAAVWFAILIGWRAGEWIGVLAVTMPSLIILFVGLVALPPFVLPVPPLPWKWPAFLAMVYTFLWLVAAWTGAINMGPISFWVYLQGLLLILRPAFPLEKVKGFVPFGILFVYGYIALVLWRIFRVFALSPFNLLVLTQGMLALSAYTLPVEGKTRDWALGLSAVYGMGYLAAMSVGRIEIGVTSFLIMFLGVAAFERFLVSGQEVLEEQWGLGTVRWVTAYALFFMYVLIWASGLGTGVLQPDWFELLTFGVGAGAIFVPAWVQPNPYWEACKAIITFNLGTNYKYQQVVGGTLVERAAGVPPNKPLSGPGILLSDADHVAVIYSSGSFNRVSPPGLTFTGAREEVKEVVDLRLQSRMADLVTTTRDGIEVKVLVVVSFRVRSDVDDPELGGRLPYNEEAVRKLVHAQRISQETQETVRWDQLVCQVAGKVARDVIAQYKLDDLNGFEARTNVVSEIGREIRTRIGNNDWGIDVIFGGIGDIKPTSQAVIQKRVEHWQAPWQRDITRLKAEAAAKRTQLIENARAEAQRELLRNLADQLSPLTKLDKDDRYDLVVIRLLAAIEHEELATAAQLRQVSDLQGRQTPVTPITPEQEAEGGES